METSPFCKRVPRSSLGGRSNASSVSNTSGRRFTLGPTINKNVTRKTIGSSGIGNSRQSVSGRSNQSLLGIRSEYNAVESYGFQLPVLVTEALTFNEKNQSIAVMFSPSGHAWLVHGRRLLIWQYKGSSSSPPKNVKDLRTAQRRYGSVAQCRELTLPHCDIGQKASLVSVFVTDSQQMASCLAVTPTGDARYWPSIAHDGSSIDANNILDGQEFDKLIYIPEQRGFFLVTTTCSLVFLELQKSNGRQVIHYRTLKQPSGILGGISRRLTMIMGMNNAHERENKFISLACVSSNEQEAILAVLADKWLQYWRLTKEGHQEQLIFEDSTLNRKIREEFQQKFWNVRAENLDIMMFLLDMHCHEDKFYILAGGVNHTHTPQMYYGIVVAAPKQHEMELVQFIPLKISQFYNSTTEQECLSLRFIVCHPYLYLYTDKAIYPLNLASSNLAEVECEKIEFHLQDDKILSAAVCSGFPLFFSRSHGLISVTPGDFDGTDFLNNSNSPFDNFSGVQNDTLMQEQTLLGTTINDNNLYMYDLDPDIIFEGFKDEVSQLKAAFVYRLKRNINMSNQIINELMQTCGKTQGVGLSGNFDRIVIKIAEDLAEDLPAADPRWEQVWEEQNAHKHALGSSSSLQIITQLREKSCALKHFVEFLHTINIWERLSSIPIGGGGILKATWLVLSDIHEKIVAAVALRSIQNKYGKIVDEVVKEVINKWRESLRGSLTVHDIFYVRVSKFQDFFSSLIEVSKKRVESHFSANNIASNICDVNSITLHILQEILNSREENKGLFTVGEEKKEYLPWTAMSGSAGIRDSLLDLIDLSVKYGARATNEPEIKTKLYGQILELIDFILDGRTTYLESVANTDKYVILEQQYHSQRRDLISILIEDRQFELAAKLAEKYFDFPSLVAICEETNNQERLDSYIKQFDDLGFSQFAINYHLRQNRQGEVFDRFKGNQAALSQFMRDHPTLSWIQLFSNGDFDRASKTLLQLAQNETEYVERKQAILSLSKLASLASIESDLTDQVENINTELNLIEYQGQLSKDIMEAYGYDLDNQKVLKVDEIINLFICEENEASNEFDFRKALELLRYMEDPYEARLKIWCAAILRDDWVNFDMNNALDYLQNTMFFKLVDVCHLIDENVDISLPSIEDLVNCHELAHVVENKSFQYLLKLAFEHIQNTFKHPIEMMET